MTFSTVIVAGVNLFIFSSHGKNVGKPFDPNSDLNLQALTHLILFSNIIDFLIHLIVPNIVFIC